MRKTFTTVDQRSSVILPREALEALRVEVGAELEIEIVGRALIIRSAEDARSSGQFMNAFDTILSKHRSAYDALSEGPDADVRML